MRLVSQLQTEVERLVALPGIDADASILHIERQERVSVSGNRRFPACSVFKVPVLVEAYRQAAMGEFSMLNRWPLAQEDKAPGSGVLQLLDPNLSPTVHDLLTLMIVISDNTAADILTQRLGPERITATMLAIGLHDTWVSVTCREMIASAFGAGDVTLLPHQRARLAAEKPPASTAAVYHAVAENDVSTANDMVDLFACIQTGQCMAELGLSADDRHRMLAILYQQQLNDRLPRHLPPTLPFAHKTGSMSGAFEIHNDAGIFELAPDQHIAVAVFTRAAAPGAGARTALNDLRRRMDDCIASVALAVYEHYSAA